MATFHVFTTKVAMAANGTHRVFDFVMRHRGGKQIRDAIRDRDQRPLTDRLLTGG